MKMALVLDLQFNRFEGIGQEASYLGNTCFGHGSTNLYGLTMTLQ